MKSLLPNFSNNPKGAYFALAALGLALLLLPIFAAQYGNGPVRLLAMALLYVMLALGLNIVVGYAGLLDLGYVAFYAVGAYVYALLSSPHLAENFEWIAQTFPNGMHTSIWFIIPISAGLAAFFGVLLGAPTLRLRGDYLAIVTLGFGEIVRIFMNNLNSPVNITNGPQGITKIDSISIGPIDFAKPYEILGITFSQTQLYYYLFLLLAVFIIIVNIRLQDSRVGRAWMAIREDEIAAKAMGINTRNTKLLAFAMGASFGGVSGAMFAAFQGFISPESFVLMESIVIIAMVVLGGMGHIPGVILGAVILYLIPEGLRYFDKAAQESIFGVELVAPEALRMLLFGLAMVVIMLRKPEGLWPAPKHGDKVSVLPSVTDVVAAPSTSVK